MRFGRQTERNAKFFADPGAGRTPALARLRIQFLVSTAFQIRWADAFACLWIQLHVVDAGQVGRADTVARLRVEHERFIAYPDLAHAFALLIVNDVAFLIAFLEPANAFAVAFVELERQLALLVADALA